MRANTVTEIHFARNFMTCEIHHDEMVAIAARKADARVAVDGDVCGAAVGRSDHFVASDGGLVDGGNLQAGVRVYESQGMVSFICDQQERWRRVGFHVSGA